jgi:ligand-binding sensor domain-containing protein
LGRYIRNEEFQTINSGTIINIFEDSRNNIWVSTYGDGIFVYDHTTKNFKNYNLKKNELNSKNIYLTFEDKNHNIWIGTDGGGVNKLNSINSTFTYFTHDEKIRNSISSNTVLSINQDTAGNMWFGTQYGLNKFDQKTGKFDFYFEKDGLPNDVIYCVLFDKKEYLDEYE